MNHVSGNTWVSVYFFKLYLNAKLYNPLTSEQINTFHGKVLIYEEDKMTSPCSVV